MAKAASSERNYMDDMNQQTRQHELSEEIANTVVTILSKHPRHTDSMEHTSQLDELVNHGDCMHLDNFATWAAKKAYNNPNASMKAGKFAARLAFPAAGPAMDAASRLANNKHFKEAVRVVAKPENRARAQQFMQGAKDGNYASAFHGAQQLFHAMKKH